MRGRRLIFAGASLAALIGAASTQPTSSPDTINPTQPASDGAVTTVRPKQGAPAPQAPTRAQLNAMKLVVDRRRESGCRMVRRRNSQPWVLRKHGGKLVAVHLTHGRR